MKTTSSKTLARHWTNICQIPQVSSVDITTDSSIYATVIRLDPKANRKNSSLIDLSTGGSVASYISEEGTTLSTSPSGARRVVLRPDRIDVCDKLGLIFSVDTAKTHGKILPATTFGSVSWNPSEDRIAYIAEPLHKDAPSFWDDDDDNDSDNEKKGDARTKFHWREDWGEQLIGISSPSIYILDISARKVTPFAVTFDPEDKSGKELNSEKEGASIGHVSWVLNGTHLVFTAWNNGPRRLGIIACTNRRSSVWCIEYKTADAPIAYRCSPDDTFSSVCPRVSPDGTYVVKHQ